MLAKELAKRLQISTAGAYATLQSVVPDSVVDMGGYQVKKVRVTDVPLNMRGPVNKRKPVVIEGKITNKHIARIINALYDGSPSIPLERDIECAMAWAIAHRRDECMTRVLERRATLRVDAGRVILD